MYDPEIGRFLSVDPLFEMQIGINPYHYCGNDPVNASDPSGLYSYFDENGGFHTVSDANIVVYSDYVPYISHDGDSGGQTGFEHGALHEPSVASDATSVNNKKDNNGILDDAKEATQLSIALTYMVVSNLPVGYECSQASNSFANGDWGLGIGWTVAAVADAGLIGSSIASSISSQKISVSEMATDVTIENNSSYITTTLHGAERIAGNSTRGGVLSYDEILHTNLLGNTMIQTDGALVKVFIIEGKYNITITGKNGLITTFKGLSDKSYNRLARKYGWRINY